MNQISPDKKQSIEQGSITTDMMRSRNQRSSGMSLDQFLRLDLKNISINLMGAEKKRFKTQYKISVGAPDFGTFIVQRNYNEFFAFYTALKLKYQNLDLPEFPNRYQLFGKVATRTVAFHLILNRILETAKKSNQGSSYQQGLLKTLYIFLTKDLARRGKQKKVIESIPLDQDLSQQQQDIFDKSAWSGKRKFQQSEESKLSELPARLSQQEEETSSKLNLAQIKELYQIKSEECHSELYSQSIIEGVDLVEEEIELESPRLKQLKNILDEQQNMLNIDDNDQIEQADQMTPLGFIKDEELLDDENIDFSSFSTSSSLIARTLTSRDTRSTTLTQSAGSMYNSFKMFFSKDDLSPDQKKKKLSYLGSGTNFNRKIKSTNFNQHNFIIDSEFDAFKETALTDLTKELPNVKGNI